MMKVGFYIFLLLLFASCNSNNKKKVSEHPSLSIDTANNAGETNLSLNDSLAGANSRGITETKRSLKDSLKDEKATTIFLALKEIKQLIDDSLVWKKSGRRFSWMTNLPDSVHNDYVFQAGYDSDIRFETRYRIHIDPTTMKAKFEDMVTDSLYSPEDYRKLKR